MNVNKNTTVAVLMGGLSKEREVSLRSGRAMAEALKGCGYKHVVEIDVDTQVAHELREKKIEVAVIALHGQYGEDGTIQGVLEFLKIPYTGTGVLGSAMAMDKVCSKQVFEACQVPTPPWFFSNPTFTPAQIQEKIEKVTGYPVVAKPSNEGSTIGLTVVKKAEEIAAAVKVAERSDQTIIWEKFIQGDELTVSFLKGTPLPIVEIVPKQGIFDYEAKYTKGMTDYYCPARISKEVAQKTEEAAIKAFAAVQAQSFGRVDLIFGEGEAWVLEVNTIPGMTETSLLPKAAKAKGIEFAQVVEQLLQDSALKTKGTDEK